jgi:mannose-6-phosphate isomerase-like protein (cupin superfamily)
MSMQSKSYVLAVLSCAIVCAVATVPRRASAERPKDKQLDSRIIRWDHAKSHVADWGEMRFYFRGETFATDQALVAVAVVQPGKSVHQAHRHPQEEYLAVVEGAGTWWLDGKESPAEKGDILYVEPWVYHGLTNTGDAPLVFLVVRYNGKGVQAPPRPDDRPDELTISNHGNEDGKRELAKVDGIVTLNGEPLAHARVVFSPATGRPATGVTDQQGRFQLTTFQQHDGAVLGRYRVAIAPLASEDTNDASDPKRKVPARYADPATTELACQVAPGSNTFAFDLAD